MKKTIVLGIAICGFVTLSLAQSAIKDCRKLESENKQLAINIKMYIST